MWRELQPRYEVREEIHYDGRRVLCFADRPATLHRMIADMAEAYPEQDALVGEEGVVSYAGLVDRAARIAGGLVAAGVEKGDRVALLMGNRFAFVEALAACQRIGAVCVPMNPLQRAPELAFALNQCGARALIFDAEFGPNLPAPEDTPTLARRFSAYGATAGAATYESLGDAAPAPVADCLEEETAVLLYTSGTTGRPKGAMLTHLSMIHSSLHFRYSFEVGPGDRRLLAVPASHVTGLIANISTALAAGAAIVFLRQFKAEAALKLVEAERVTHALNAPAIYMLMLLHPDFDKYDLSAWRVGGYGGAPTPEANIAELARRAPQMSLMNGYGATEATSPQTTMPAHLTPDHADSVGYVLHCAEVKIMDDDGREVPPGETGEIWMKGPNVVPGYWDNPEANAANFVDGWWKSGDLGAMDEAGFVYVRDRKKDMLNRGGYKIYSSEVENQLSFHPEIVECAIIARPCEVLGERVRAIVVAKTGGSAALADDIRAFAAARLSEYKVPEDVIFRAEPLPRNPNGKVIKTVLRDEYAGVPAGDRT